MTIQTLAGIQSLFASTPSLRQHYRVRGKITGEENQQVLLLVHGNFSSSVYYEELMLALIPDEEKSKIVCIAPDLRGYGHTEDKIIDATQGAKQWSADLGELLKEIYKENFDTLRVHIAGWSLGGAVVYQFAADYPKQTASLVLFSPISPYGFGGSKGLNGEPCFEDCAGSGGGVVNKQFVEKVKEQDMSSNMEDPSLPRTVMNKYFYKAPFKSAREDIFLAESMLEKIGEEKYPGDATASTNWPGVAPGKFGPMNATSAKYLKVADDFLTAFKKAGITENAPNVLWFRGESDQIVADNSLFDIATLGKYGIIPGYPGEAVMPPQPMVGQTRTLLEKYTSLYAGTTFKEVVVDAGHSCFLEKPAECLQELSKFLQLN